MRLFFTELRRFEICAPSVAGYPSPDRPEPPRVDLSPCVDRPARQGGSIDAWQPLEDRSSGEFVVARRAALGPEAEDEGEELGDDLVELDRHQLADLAR